MSDKELYKTGQEECGVCGNVLNARTLVESENFPAKPLLTMGDVIAKVPIVLAERTVQIDVEATIKLDRPAIEIKRIKKELFLTQCRLLPKVGKLFLSGFVRKNIEYATGDCVKGTTVSGDIRHTTVNVPFETVAHIPFILGTKPMAFDNGKTRTFQNFDPCVMGADTHEQDIESTQFFNEKIFCELVSVKFVEADIVTDKKPVDCHIPVEATFQSITEKLVIFLTFKLLQLQQVKVKGLSHDYCDNKDDNKDDHKGTKIDVVCEAD